MTALTTIRTTLFENNFASTGTTTILSRAAAVFVRVNPSYGQSLFDEKFLLDHADLFKNGIPSARTLAIAYVGQLGRAVSESAKPDYITHMMPVAAQFLRIYKSVLAV
ncbi:MAG: hypothetical protein M9928_03255 [Anaerolineae bacterium]|nr:hypothetical protein [Anaerolineae bacterium]MCO5204023.1 hypothetical protein [Anaerolineae bacterium]